MKENGNLSSEFENIFQRLVNSEEVDLCNPDVSLMFEVIATNLLRARQERDSVYFDGAVGITASKRKSRQIEFSGQMWVGQNLRQWKEPFRVLVTDKRITNQDITAKVWIGPDEGEGVLAVAFGSPA